VPFFQRRRKRVHVPHREVRDHADAPWLTLLLEAPGLVAESDAEIPGLQPYEVAALVGDSEPEHVAVELHRTVEVRDREEDVIDTRYQRGSVARRVLGILCWLYGAAEHDERRPGEYEQCQRDRERVPVHQARLGKLSAGVQAGQVRVVAELAIATVTHGSIQRRVGACSGKSEAGEPEFASS